MACWSLRALVCVLSFICMLGHINARTNPFFSSNCPTLLITQYYCNGNNKDIEIFNYGNSAVDLTAKGMKLGQWTNGARQDFSTHTAPSMSQDLTGVISSGATIVVGRFGTSPLPSYLTPEITSTLTYSGDDSLILMYTDAMAGDVYCDIISILNNPTATEAYVRDISVTAASATFYDDFSIGWTQYSVSAVNSAGTNTNQRLDYHFIPGVPSGGSNNGGGGGGTGGGGNNVPSGSGVNTYRLAAWNVQVFGLTKMSDPDVVNIIIKNYLRYDIATMEEIRDASNTAFPSLMSQLNARAQAEFGGAVVYDSVVSQRLGATSSKEQYAIIYNTAKFEVVGTYQYNVSYDVFARPPFAALIHVLGTQLQFAMIVVHTEPTEAPREIDGLVDVYNAVSANFSVAAAVILGDFNAGCTYWSASDKDVCRLWTDPRFTWLIPDSDDTTSGPTVCAYDRFVTAGLTDYTNATSAGPFNYQAAYGLNDTLTADVSDHYPIEVQIYVDLSNSSGSTAVSSGQLLSSLFLLLMLCVACAMVVV